VEGAEGLDAAGVGLDEDDEEAETSPMYNLGPCSARIALLWRDQNTADESCPDALTTTFFPPGCSGKKGVTSYTFPSITTQQSSFLLC